MPIRLVQGVLAETRLDEAVLLDSQGGQYFSLNTTATFMLRELLAGKDQAQAVAALVAKFDVAPEQAARDLATLLETLVEQGLIEPVSR